MRPGVPAAPGQTPGTGRPGRSPRVGPPRPWFLSVCRLASSAVIWTLRLPSVRYEAPGSPGIEYRGDQGDPPGSLIASAGEAP